MPTKEAYRRAEARLGRKMKEQALSEGNRKTQFHRLDAYNRQVNKSENGSKERVCGIVAKHGEMTVRQIAHKANLKTTTVQSYLEQSLKVGMISRRGNRFTGYRYFVEPASE